MNPTRVSLDIRPFAQDDTDAVLSLLQTALGSGPAGERSPAFFRWKHLENPFGRSYMLLAWEHGRVVGFRSFLRWRFEANGERVTAVRAVDTATHPDHQGRGIFRQLTMSAIDDLRSSTDLIFNTPNDKSLPGYLKMGWQRVDDVAIRVRVRRPVRFLRHVRSYREPRVGDDDRLGAGTDSDAPWSDLAALATGDIGSRLSTPRTEAYLRWRFAGCPQLRYRVVAERDTDGLAGAAVYRLRPRGNLREATVVELLIRPEDRRRASSVLRRVVRESGVDHLTCSFPRDSVQLGAASRAGFIRSPEGITLVANPLRSLALDVSSPGSWALTLGDLEVF
jgi:GNAT superfamily N-acetyltransferase